MESEGPKTQVHIDKWGSWVYLAVRLIHVAQGALCIVSGRRSYRRPRLAVGVFAMCGATSAWIARRSLRSGFIDKWSSRADVIVGSSGLVGLAAAMKPEDRTTSLNWMLPYTVGATLGLGLSVEPVPEGIGAAATMASLYLATTASGRSNHGAPGRAVTAAANAMSYAGFYAVATSIISVWRKTSRELDEARDLAQERGERLAVEHERNRQHRLLHDSAIQTLEAVAAGLHSNPAVVQAQARVEAARLRRALAEADSVEDSPDAVDHALRDLIAEFSELGLHCELSMLETPALSPASTEALLEATREALRNVLKHAGVDQAIVSCAQIEGGARVTIRDQGRGFVLEHMEPGFGYRQSVLGRLAEVGGRAEVWAQPDRGTRVTLWVPK